MQYPNPLTFFNSNESIITAILLFILTFAILQLSINQIMPSEERRFGSIIAASIAAISTYGILMMGISIDQLLPAIPYIGVFILLWLISLSIIHFAGVENKWVKVAIFIGLLALGLALWWLNSNTTPYFGF